MTKNTCNSSMEKFLNNFLDIFLTLFQPTKKIVPQNISSISRKKKTEISNAVKVKFFCNTFIYNTVKSLPITG